MPIAIYLRSVVGYSAGVAHDHRRLVMMIIYRRLSNLFHFPVLASILSSLCTLLSLRPVRKHCQKAQGSQQ